MWVGSVLEDQDGFCPKCGEVQQPGQTICRWCGATLDAPPPAREHAADSLLAPSVLPDSPKPSEKFCAECGEMLPGRAKFCWRCGADATQPVVTQTPKPKVVAQAPPAPVAPPPAQAKQQSPAAGCVVLIVLLLCVGFVVWRPSGGSATPTAIPVNFAPAPAAKSDSDLTGDDWLAYSSREKTALVGRVLGRMSNCHLATADGVTWADGVFVTPELHGQKVAEMIIIWAVTAGCK